MSRAHARGHRRQGAPAHAHSAHAHLSPSTHAHTADKTHVGTRIIEPQRTHHGPATTQPRPLPRTRPHQVVAGRPRSWTVCLMQCFPSLPLRTSPRPLFSPGQTAYAPSATTAAFVLSPTSLSYRCVGAPAPACVCVCVYVGVGVGVVVSEGVVRRAEESRVGNVCR